MLRAIIIRGRSARCNLPLRPLLIDLRYAIYIFIKGAFDRWLFTLDPMLNEKKKGNTVNTVK